MRLPRIVGHGRAMDMILTGRPVRADEAHAWGLPVMAEMVPGGFDSPPELRTARSVAIATRVGAELGSDWMKIPYAEDFAQVTETCYVPAVILGGAKKGSERVMLEKIRASTFNFQLSVSLVLASTE